MLSKIKSIALNGLEGNLIEIQTDISNGLPEVDIVGLPDISVKESKKRIKSAIKNSGIEFPNKKILINLAPANIKKGGSSFDVVMAIGILLAMNNFIQIEQGQLANTIFIGELSLDGKLNRVEGVLPMCMEAKELGIKNVILPRANANEASIIKELNIIPANDIIEIIDHLNGNKFIKSYNSHEIIFNEKYDIDFSEVKGQENVKRALEIVAAGGHNCLLIGSPGSRKNNACQKTNNNIT